MTLLIDRFCAEKNLVYAGIALNTEHVNLDEYIRVYVRRLYVFFFLSM